LGNGVISFQISYQNPAIRQLARLLIGARWRDTAPTRRRTGQAHLIRLDAQGAAASPKGDEKREED
jgi:hypothetical protein